MLPPFLRNAGIRAIGSDMLRMYIDIHLAEPGERIARAIFDAVCAFPRTY